MAITYSITPPTSLQSGTNKTNVVNIPNDYFLNVPTGEINVVSGDNTRIDAGADAEVIANDNITVEATGGIVSIESKGSEVTVDAASDITLTAGDTILAEAATSVTIETPETFVKSNTTLGDDVDSNTTEFKSKVDSNILPKEPTFTIGDESNIWQKSFFDEGEYFSGNNPGNPYVEFGPTGRPYDPADIYDSEANRRLASVYVAGGVGIEKDLNVGGRIYGRIEIANTSFQLVVTSTNVDQVFHPLFALNSGEQFVYVDNTGTLSGGLTYNPFTGKLGTELLRIYNTATATASTGSIRVDGGISVGKNIVTTDVTPPEDAETAAEVYGLGNTSTQWAEAYVHDLYTKVIASTDNSNIEIKPQGGLTDVYGDILVRGINPIGTAPVVSNTLYVTMDGDDTNDGRAIDASRACRTINGAVNSPYYQPGTQILVSAGFYLEDNPVRMKPYTSIRGADIRTTFIEPINKTQDLFHVESGCYINYCTFLNGRSGLLEGDYEPEFNRGAYATAFPPQEGDDRIDLFHSPYIQNCTNQSGPWLKDGTMFVPNQTVQVPRAVGTGTWVANTTTLIVNAGTGTIVLGDYVNAGQQNPGFFSARTLMLANKPFMQEQVVAYVDATFNSGSFTYNVPKCKRDLGLIVDSISMDMLYNSDSDSIFSGLQYWSQTTSAILGQETTTTAAINYLKGLAATIVLNAGGATPQTTVNALFTTVTNIIANGTVGVSDWIEASPNGLASTNVNTVAAYTALIANKATLKTQVISWITTNHPAFVYNTSTCARDVGNIIDSVAFDLLHGGKKQSIKSGVYYYNYSSTSTQIVNEVPQTTAAYNYLKSIIPNIVKGVPLPTLYQTVTPQVIIGQPKASTYEAEALQDKIDVITNIIRNGPDVVTTQGPINLEINPSEEAVHAFNILAANKNFIKEEVVAFINSTTNVFNYSREYCYRDVGILVENVAYDAAFGGNQKSIESGLAYYDGVISRISGQESQTSAAIDYLNQMVQAVIVNNTWTNILTVPAEVAPFGTNSQVRNTVLLGGDIAASSIDSSFNTIVTIINNGPDAAPAMYKSGGPDAAFVSAEILMQANRRFIQEDTVNYVNNMVKSFPYSKIACKRDVGLIVDSIATDLLYPTTNRSQSTFSGLQYWAQGTYTGDIPAQIGPTIDAVTYLKELSLKVIRNVTPTDDLVNRYQSVVTQNTSLEPASIVEAKLIAADFDIVLEILRGNKKGWTDRIIPNGDETNLLGVKNAYNLLIANKDYMAAEVLAYVNAIHPDITFNTSTCARDVGLITNSIAFDLTHGGNRQAIQAGLSYYAASGSTSTIHGQESQTIVAFNRIKTIIAGIMTGTQVVPTTGTNVSQVLSTSTATVVEVAYVQSSISTITDIIIYGAGVAADLTSVGLTATTATSVINGFNLLKANRAFIVDDVVNFVDWTYNQGSFNYNEEKCFRDTGLLVDAVSQDILLGGNTKVIEAGLGYWIGNYNYVTGQETTTTMAIAHARDIALQIIANTPVTVQTGTEIAQVINTYFQYGGDYMPQEAVRRGFNTISDIITRGPIYAPPVYMGGGLFSLTGINGADVKISPIVTSVTTITTGTYLVGLDTPTIGFGNNATLYFGETLIFPKRDYEIEELSLEYTGSTSTWNQRKIDTIGSMGGSLVDGAVISDRSPINSFVYDAFTQVNQGGRGVRITNNGYAQLVSVFTIFCSTGVEVDNGGIASIVNSNANFGNLCLVAKGFGKRTFSGTIYNPINKSYPDDPEFNEFYPTGFWPNNARARVFLPDLSDRPHISLVMEIEPPDLYTDFQGNVVPYTNEQGFPGFLNAVPNLGVLATGTITITGIDTTGIAVGNALYVRDQFGNQTATNGILYSATDTVVTDIGYQSVTLSKALTSGGQDPENTTSSVNTNYFNLYFCGNAYYTVLSSEVGDNPIPVGTNVLRDAPTGDQRPTHISSLSRLQQIVIQAIKNDPITPTTGTNTGTQIKLPLLIDGGLAETFITQRFENIIQIINPTLATPPQADTLAGAEAVVKPSLRTKTGPVVQGAGSAIALITANLDYFVEEISDFVQSPSISPPGFIYNDLKCRRDTKLILQRLIYDIETGGRYNSVMTGLSYWQRDGTHHLVQMGENVRRTDLFPDGATVNFYQRSYISASGYVFEYVGAGVDYGALPQRGVADPVQSKEVVQLDSGKVFFTSTDQNGDFRIGPGLVISQATGVLSGRTFTKSLFANMTPFILAIEAG
jgi:hypothetical protein